MSQHNIVLGDVCCPQARRTLLGLGRSSIFSAEHQLKPGLRWGPTPAWQLHTHATMFIGVCAAAAKTLTPAVLLASARRPWVHPPHAGAPLPWALAMRQQQGPRVALPGQAVLALRGLRHVAVTRGHRCAPQETPCTPVGHVHPDAPPVPYGAAALGRSWLGGSMPQHCLILERCGSQSR